MTDQHDPLLPPKASARNRLDPMSIPDPLFPGRDNSKLCYEYARFCFEGANKSLDETSRKLTVLLPVSTGLFVAGLFIHSDLPWFHNLPGLLSGLSVILCGCGLLPRSISGVISVDELLHSEWYYKPDEDCRRYIAGAWRDTILQIRSVQGVRARFFQSSLFFVFASIVFFCLGAIQ